MIPYTYGIQTFYQNIHTGKKTASPFNDTEQTTQLQVKECKQSHIYITLNKTQLHMNRGAHYEAKYSEHCRKKVGNSVELKQGTDKYRHYESKMNKWDLMKLKDFVYQRI